MRFANLPNFLRFLLVCTLVLVGLSRVDAATCYALTNDNRLLTFDSAAPTLATALTITNLSGYDLVGIDIRTTRETKNPQNPGIGSLWAIGVSGALYQLFQINPGTGVATPIGTPRSGISTVPGPNGWFFGFNPATDRIRFAGFISNYEINPNTLTVTTQSVANLGFINFNGSAFSTASFGGNSSMYFVEVGGDALNTSANFTTGAYTTVGPLGIDISLPTGLDTYESTTLLAATVGGFSGLYNVNRTTGAAGLIGLLVPNVPIRGLAIVPPVYPKGLPVTVRITGKKKVTTSRPNVVVRGTASSAGGVSRVNVKLNGAAFKKARGTTNWNARVHLKSGRNVIRAQAIGNANAKSKIVSVIYTRK